MVSIDNVKAKVPLNVAIVGAGIGGLAAATLLDLVPEGEVLEWKLCDHASLPRWIEGKVALMGDAAHPMLPYVAQGAAQTVEDGAVLAASLAMIDSIEQIQTALKMDTEIKYDYKLIN
ncbi:unnamed protein product [Rotaria sp. Silwood1]|nr:unnamed protein product [Rotaria sp. Silwood1]CAF4836755.1 unnamed protein product [Rotaria sp. Silwood1]